jgi:SYP5 family syntaxin
VTEGGEKRHTRRVGEEMEKMDSWLKEFQEALQLADDIEAGVQERNKLPAHSSEGTRIVSASRRKLTRFNTKLDRLESLLQNPPLRTSLNEKELYRRQDMLLTIRFKSKQMAASVSSSQAANRANLLEGGITPVETNRTQGLENSGLIGLQRQIMREQDEDLEGLESTVLSTKHIALAVNEELDLHSRLLSDMDQDADVTNNRLKATQKKLGFLNKNSGQGWSLMTMCILMVVIVVLVLVLFKLL